MTIILELNDNNIINNLKMCHYFEIKCILFFGYK